MKINAQQIKCMTLIIKNKLKQLILNMFSISSISIENVHFFKFHRRDIDKHFSWEENVSRSCTRISSKTSLWYKLE